MLCRFSVRNYKNFKDMISIDFTRVSGYEFNRECITDGSIGKMLIYGKNATGKTNLGNAIVDIQNIILGVPIIGGSFLANADSENKVIEFAYVFSFNGETLEYSYKRNDDRNLLGEKLVINQERVFEIDFIKNKYDFCLEKINAETVITDIYINSINELQDMDEGGTRLPFLRWLLANAALNGAPSLIMLSNYVRNMRMHSFRFAVSKFPGRSFDKFYELLSVGDNLRRFENFLNDMGIICTLDLLVLPDGKKELYFHHDQPIPFIENASSGTIALMNLYMAFILPGNKATLIYMDEFDAFYHYEMSDKVIQYFKKYFSNCQVVMTTHNTNLMNNRWMRPDCLFILSQDGRLTALCDATERELREGHNLEKMYISGEFANYE